MNTKYWVDVAERVVATFVEAFLGVWLAALLAGVPITNTAALEGAAVAGVIAALSLVKVLAARFIGDKDSAGLLPLK